MSAAAQPTRRQATIRSAAQAALSDRNAEADAMGAACGPDLPPISLCRIWCHRGRHVPAKPHLQIVQTAQRCVQRRRRRLERSQRLRGRGAAWLVGGRIPWLLAARTAGPRSLYQMCAGALTRAPAAAPARHSRTRCLASALGFARKACTNWVAAGSTELRRRGAAGSMGPAAGCGGMRRHAEAPCQAPAGAALMGGSRAAGHRRHHAEPSSF